MKKIMSLLTVMGLALTFGLAYADEISPMTRDMSGNVLYNGITYFEPVLECPAEGGSGAGGVAAGEVSKDAILKNGITFFDVRAAGYGPRCSWAGELSKELHVKNGITVPGGSDL
jgi:hypothetical protein